MWVGKRNEKKAISTFAIFSFKTFVTQFEISPKDIYLKQTVFLVFIKLAKNLAFIYNQSSLFVFKKPSYHLQISSKIFFCLISYDFRYNFFKRKKFAISYIIWIAVFIIGSDSHFQISIKTQLPINLRDISLFRLQIELSQLRFTYTIISISHHCNNKRKINSWFCCFFFLNKKHTNIHTTHTIHLITTIFKIIITFPFSFNFPPSFFLNIKNQHPTDILTYLFFKLDVV